MDELMVRLTVSSMVELKEIDMVVLTEQQLVVCLVVLSAAKLELTSVE
jgi:hypothetical protein